jgi:hypothetical protein
MVNEKVRVVNRIQSDLQTLFPELSGQEMEPVAGEVALFFQWQ